MNDNLYESAFEYELALKLRKAYILKLDIWVEIKNIKINVKLEISPRKKRD